MGDGLVIMSLSPRTSLSHIAYGYRLNYKQTVAMRLSLASWFSFPYNIQQLCCFVFGPTLPFNGQWVVMNTYVPYHNCCISTKMCTGSRIKQQKWLPYGYITHPSALMWRKHPDNECGSSGSSVQQQTKHPHVVQRSAQTLHTSLQLGDSSHTLHMGCFIFCWKTTSAKTAQYCTSFEIWSPFVWLNSLVENMSDTPLPLFVCCAVGGDLSGCPHACSPHARTCD